MEKHIKRIAEELTKIRKHLENKDAVDVQEIRSMVEASKRTERR